MTAKNNTPHIRFLMKKKMQHKMKYFELINDKFCLYNFLFVLDESKEHNTSWDYYILTKFIVRPLGLQYCHMIGIIF